MLGLRALAFLCGSRVVAVGARMSEVSYEQIGLDELVSRSTVIAVVRRDHPVTETEEIDIHPDREKYPPFVLTLSRFVVVEALREGGVRPDQAIAVLPANSALELEDHKQYHLHHMGESPIYDAYTPIDAPAADSEFIVFLFERDDGRYEFSVEGACEGLASKAKVQEAIKRSGSSDLSFTAIPPDWD